MAGYGVQLWPILQDVHQLRATYGQRAGTFLSNAGVLQVFGVNDHDSARLVSDLLGQETVVFQTMSRALDAEKTGITYGEQHTARPLLTPDEVRNLPQNVELLFLAGQRPIVAGKLAYYADSEFRGCMTLPDVSRSGPGALRRDFTNGPPARLAPRSTRRPGASSIQGKPRPRR